MKKRKKTKFVCPIHSEKLIVKKTRYGFRHSCPIEGCTVVCWGNETSTPADFETRQKRHEAHLIFDGWWKGKIKRTEAYKLLSKYLDLPIQKTHIGHFDIRQCEKVIKFVEEQS